MKLFVLGLSIFLFILFNKSESFNGSGNEYFLENSRLGNLNKILKDDDKHFQQIQRQFPLNIRTPLNYSNVNDFKGNLKKNKAIIKMYKNYSQNKNRIAEFHPTPINKDFINSSGSKNFILENSFKKKVSFLIDKYKKNYSINSTELIGARWQEIDRFNAIKSFEIKSVIYDFLDKLNKLNKSIENDFVFIDQDDAKIEKSYPITSGNTNLGKEITKYTIVFFIQDKKSLAIIGLKGVFVDSKVLLLDIIGEKGDTESGFHGNEFYNINGTSREDMVLSDIQKKEILDKHQEKLKLPQGICFGADNKGSGGGGGITEQECISKNGFYDFPVKNNYSCPFYQKNKNYLNSRGGSRSGFCELPIGLNLKGFRNIEPGSEPLCYNCINENGQKTIGDCCKEQASDKIKYPKLKSPDYAFPSDTLERFNRRSELHTLGLSWNKNGFLFENEIPIGLNESSLT